MRALLLPVKHTRSDTWMKQRPTQCGSKIAEGELYNAHRTFNNPSTTQAATQMQRSSSTTQTTPLNPGLKGIGEMRYGTASEQAKTRTSKHRRR
jgi:hypothetical protein